MVVRRIGEFAPKRRTIDWVLVAIATGILLAFATIARVPQFSFDWGPALALTSFPCFCFLSAAANFGARRGFTDRVFCGR